MKYTAVLILSMAGIMISSCSSKQEINPAQEQTESKQEQAEQKVALAKQIADTDTQYDKELVQKIKNADNPPPIVQTSIDVLNSEHISVTDVERAWLFQRSSYIRCYELAVTRDETAKGNVDVTVKREPGSSAPTLVSLKSEIQTDQFESCLKEAPVRWRLPENATVEVRIHFSSHPGLTAKELADQAASHRKNDPTPAVPAEDDVAPTPQQPEE